VEIGGLWVGWNQVALKGSRGRVCIDVTVPRGCDVRCGLGSDGEELSLDELGKEVGWWFDVRNGRFAVPDLP
jgi:hypothetical protein